jgi:Flp pilus assembly protein TadG
MMRNLVKTNSYDYRRRWIGKLARRTAMGGDLGHALVELSLVFPILVLLLVGAAEFGSMAYATIEVSNAAHAGVQYGAQNHATASDNAGMQAAALDDGPNVTGLAATATHFCGCSNGAASSCLATDCAGARILEYVQVNTTATVSPVMYYPGLPRTFTLRGQAIMRVEQ